jgi:hypothetical protein
VLLCRSGVSPAQFRVILVIVKQAFGGWVRLGVNPKGERHNVSDDKSRPATTGDVEASERRIVDAVRDMQTGLLRGFASFSTAHTLRLRKVEAEQSNLDAALSARVDVLEKRLLKIELRLGLSS